MVDVYNTVNFISFVLKQRSWPCFLYREERMRILRCWCWSVYKIPAIVYVCARTSFILIVLLYHLEWKHLMCWEIFKKSLSLIVWFSICLTSVLFTEEWCPFEPRGIFLAFKECPRCGKCWMFTLYFREMFVFSRKACICWCHVSTALLLVARRSFSSVLLEERSKHHKNCVMRALSLSRSLARSLSLSVTLSLSHSHSLLKAKVILPITKKKRVNSEYN